MSYRYLRSTCAALFFVACSPEAMAASATPAAFQTWLKSFRAVALERGITAETYDKYTAGLKPDFRLPDLDLGNKAAQPEQPEFIKTPADYLDDGQLANLARRGREMQTKYMDTLARIEKTYGVDKTILLAIWGRETAFSTHRTPYNALDVLATQAYTGNRRDLFQTQFIDGLRLVQERVIEPERMRSSWAGAMGMLQILPSDYFKYGVSADGNGRPDLWNSVPDALATLANTLKQNGWVAGVPWGVEVDAPDVDCTLAYLDERKSFADWSRLNVSLKTEVKAAASIKTQETSLLMAAGIYGPRFLTSKNFQVIREYNRSDLYALFVGNLADRIGGRGGFSTPWKRVVQVSSKDVTDLQKRLTAAGLYKDTIDGKAGGRTRSAVGRFQADRGLQRTCWPTEEIIAYAKEKLPRG